jgi:hypothetical protein
MAPEQAAGRAREVGPAADVYSLGAILYELLTGRPPFQAPTAAATLLKVIGEEPVPVRRLQPAVPPDLETICHKAMARSPRRRYATARELADDLRRHLDGEPIRARPMGRAERLGRWCRLNPVAATLLVAVTLGSAAGLGHLANLSRHLVRASALEGAALQASLLREAGDTYSSEVVRRIDPEYESVPGAPARPPAVPITEAYQDRGGAIPIPTTFTKVLMERYSEHTSSGARARIYSDYPWPGRTDGGPHDDFERRALADLRANPDEPVSSFEDRGGRLVLRYAEPLRMKETCLECHNHRPDSPRKDWREGEVRGVLEIIRPLDSDQRRIRAGLWDTFVLVGTTALALLGLGAGLLVVGRRRRSSLPPALFSRSEQPARAQ